MLPAPTRPGLFVVGTDTGVGKTVVAAAIGQWFAHRGARVGPFKPVATGCEPDRGELVSDDAVLLASACSARVPLNVIAPLRWREPLAPALAAERSGRRPDWEHAAAALREIERSADVLVIEGAGGILTPVDRGLFGLDLVAAAGLPVVVVARAQLGTINHTLMTVGLLRAAGCEVAGVVVNLYPPEFPDAAEETAAGAIERWGNVPVLCVVPRVDAVRAASVPADVAAAVDTVDWARLARLPKRVEASPSARRMLAP